MMYPSSAGRARTRVSFLQDKGHSAELRDIQGWKAHQLTGDRRGSRSLTVARNWRITFRIDDAQGEIVDLDYADYH